jgi:dsRNA-specific ribonuclease
VGTGEISELQSIKGSNRNLAEKGFFLGLDRFLAEVRESNDAVSVGTKKMATTVEALIGAVYLDSYRHPTRRNTIDDAGSAAANLFLFDWPREEDY